MNSLKQSKQATNQAN